MKNNRKLKTNVGTIRTKDIITGIVNKQRIHSKNISAEKSERSLAVVSSKYSNSNTA